MRIKAIVLFGSCARGDQKKDSDVDLLAIHDEKIYRIDELGTLNFSLYSIDSLTKMMFAGELFALHLVRESKVLFEQDNIVFDIYSKFTFKKSYAEVIYNANMLAWYIIKFYNSIEKAELSNKRLIWCLRTISAALAAEKHQSCFSAQSIIELTPLSFMPWLLKQKNNVKPSKTILEKMRCFLRYHKLYEPSCISELEEIQDGIRLFESHSMGYKFIRSIRSKNMNGGYL